jgi:CheY-like chemotaxis protein
MMNNNGNHSRPMEILLVEDNQQDADRTTEALREGGVPCRVTLVSDGEEAIDFLQQEGVFAGMSTPDLVLLDMLLPKKEGHHVLAAIRSDEALKSIPVVVLTGSLVHRTILKAQGLDVEGFMSKPVDFKKFLDVVKSLHRSWLTQLVVPSVG